MIEHISCSDCVFFAGPSQCRRDPVFVYREETDWCGQWTGESGDTVGHVLSRRRVEAVAAARAAG